MHPNPYRIAFIPLARPTFDIPLANEVTQAARAALQSAGLELIGPDELVTDLPAAQAAAGQIAQWVQRGQPPDLLLIFQATFADSSMVTALAEAAPAPVFLWAIPEERSGGRLRLNSLCGINLAGHALTLRKTHYDYAYALPGDEVVIRQISALAAAANVRRRLQTARLGVIGEHPAGMDSCHLDEPLLREKFGLQIQRISLEEVFARARSVSQAQIAAVRASMDQRLSNLAELDQKPLGGTFAVYTALRQAAEEYHLDGLAVRCWPEFFTELGCSACGAMSMLSDGALTAMPLPCSCEADINGTVTQLILQWLASAPAFGSDMVAIDFDEDIVALWHCGLAPLSMADPAFQPRGTIHSNRRLPLVMEFPLKAGQVTIARISQSAAISEAALSGKLRLVLGLGEMLAAPAPFSGTSGTLRLERPARHFFDALMQEGLEHHVSLTYGDYLLSLQALARLLAIPVYRL